MNATAQKTYKVKGVLFEALEDELNHIVGIGGEVCHVLIAPAIEPESAVSGVYTIIWKWPIKQLEVAS